MRFLVYLLGWSLVALIGSGASPTHRDAEPPPAQLTAQQLKDQIRSACQRIRSIRVSYMAEGYDPQTVYPGTYVHRTVIAKAPCSLFHDTGHGYPGMPWEEDLFRQTAYITATQECNVYPTNRGYFARSLPSDAGLPGSLSWEVVFLATGVWPLSGRKAPKPYGYPHMLHEIAQSGDYDQVRPHQEMVDGRWCHVLLSKGRDALWLDASRGCCVMRREIAVARTGALGTRYTLGGYHEVAQGIWMPKTIHYEQYDYSAPTEKERKRIIRDTPIEILDLSVNDVEDSVFQYKSPPGALELDARNIFAPARQSQPGGLDHLNNVVDWLRRYGMPGTARTSSFPRYLNVLCALIVLSTIVGCEAWARLRSRHGAGRISQQE